MNIAQRITEAAAATPTAPAVIFPAGRDAHGRYTYSHLSFARLAYESDVLAARMAALGIGPGVKTLLFVRPSLAFSLVTFALFKLGAVPVLIDPGMGRANLLRAITEVQPQALIGEPLVHVARLLYRLPLAAPGIRITTGRYGFGLARPLAKMLPQARDCSPVAFTSYTAESDELAAILFTSGGTGKPKGVLYSHRIFAEQVELIRKLFDLQPGDKDLAGFPLFSLLTMAMGITSVIPPMDPSRPAQADPAALVQTILEQGVTTANGSPAIWERVGHYCTAQGLSLPSLRALMMYGAPVASSLHDLFAPLLPHGTTYTPYGATECLPVSVITGREVMRETAALSAQGAGTCIGHALAGTQVKIIRPSRTAISHITAAEELPCGEVGELVVMGRQATAAYFNDERATAGAKIAGDKPGEFWHRMGDLAYLDKQERLWFCGRQAHMVAGATEPFYSIPCEAIFNQHPAIRRTALIGIRTQAGAEEAQACLAVERRDQQTSLPGDVAQSFRSELLALARAYPHTQAIKHFYLHASFPVDPRHNIKIDRLALAAYFSKAGRKPL